MTQTFYFKLATLQRICGSSCLRRCLCMENKKIPVSPPSLPGQSVTNTLRFKYYLWSKRTHVQHQLGPTFSSTNWMKPFKLNILAFSLRSSRANARDWALITSARDSPNLLVIQSSFRWLGWNLITRLELINISFSSGLAGFRPSNPEEPPERRPWTIFETSDGLVSEVAGIYYCILKSSLPGHIGGCTNCFGLTGVSSNPAEKLCSVSGTFWIFWD